MVATESMVVERARTGISRSVGSHALLASGNVAILDVFFEFHSEVVRLKRLVTGKGLTAPPAPDVVRQRLLDAFEMLGARVAKKLSDHELRVLDQARYVMIAMADEVFLHVDWPGRMPWADKPLEAHVFRTHDAGERVFRQIDDLLAGRAAASTELCSIYLAVLALGFRGKYAVSGGTEPDEYRRRLAEALARSEPDLLSSDDALCPEAYAHTLDTASRKQLPPWLRGFIAPILVLVGWIVVAQIIWVYWTSRLDDPLDKIESSR